MLQITVSGVRKVPNPSKARPPCSAKIIDITVVKMPQFTTVNTTAVWTKQFVSYISGKCRKIALYIVYLTNESATFAHNIILITKITIYDMSKVNIRWHSINMATTNMKLTDSRVTHNVTNDAFWVLMANHLDFFALNLMLNSFP